MCTKLVDYQGPKQVITMMVEQDTKIKLKCSLLWSWWKARNKTIGVKGPCNPDHVATQVLKLADDDEYEEFLVGKTKFL